MSTTDPAIAARDRRARPASTARVAVLIVLQFAGGLLTGSGWASFSTIFEVDAEALSAGSEAPFLALAPMVTIPIGMTVLVASSIAWSATVLRRSDIGLAYGGGAALLGGSAGVFTAAATAPSEAEPTLLRVVAAALIVLAALAFALGAVAARARHRQGALERELMRTGTLATATVTDQGYLLFGESTRILATVTFSFVDAAGTTRWVRKAMVIRAEQPLKTGDTTRLWYDGTRPGDEERIVVEAAVLSPVRPLPPVRAAD